MSIIYQNNTTSKGPLLLGQFSELDTSGNNSSGSLFSRETNKEAFSALPTRVRSLKLAPSLLTISHPPPWLLLIPYVLLQCLYILLNRIALGRSTSLLVMI